MFILFTVFIFQESLVPKKEKYDKISHSRYFEKKKLNSNQTSPETSGINSPKQQPAVSTPKPIVIAPLNDSFTSAGNEGLEQQGEDSKISQELFKFKFRKFEEGMKLGT